MKQFNVFMRKEFTELFRTGKAALLLIVYSIFGIMNPALAKLTPWMLSLMSESLADQGVVIGSMTVNALTAWTQYFKNMFMEYVLALALFCGIFSTEFQSGTLINILTKGLARWKTVAAKWVVMLACWSVCYWLTFGITFGYSAYFWSNANLSGLMFSVFCSYVLGIWLLSVELAFSAFFRSGIYALIGTGAIYTAAYALGVIPALSAWLPVRLDSSFSLLTGALASADFTVALCIAAILSVLNVALAIAAFQKKRL